MGDPVLRHHLLFWMTEPCFWHSAARMRLLWGGRKDFNMAFLSPVPGQEYSVKYVNMVTGWLHQPFYIGGHSKGGNLAVYSGMKCAPLLCRNGSRRSTVWMGLGFRPEVLKECHYNAIEGKVVK